jgi:hypothetical protein
MRPWLALTALLALAAPPSARADMSYETRTAVEACLAAVIDAAPVVDAKGQDVAIHRDRNPNLCAVTASAGSPSEVHDAVMAAIATRPEGFAPAKTAWDPGVLARRETLCNPPGRRALAVVIETARPGGSPVLVATVVESRKRDPRCDSDMGLQR